MKWNRLPIVIPLLFIILWPGKAVADELLLKNGDRITGTVVTMKDSVLLFKTSYAGDISIKWEEIESLTSDSPINIILSDQTSAHGMVTPSEEGKLRLDAEQVLEPLTFDLAQVEQINPPEKPTVILSPRVNLGATVAKGNTDTKTYHSDAQLIARTEKNRYTVGGEYNREEDDDTKTADNALGYLKYDHFLTEKWYFTNNATFENDEFKDLNLKTTVGVGLGYQFFETELINLSFEAGPAYVNVDYDEADDDSYFAGRWSANYNQYFLDKRVQFFHIHAGFVSLEDTEDMFVRSRTGFRLPLYEKFNATIQYNFDWDNTPSPGDDRVDERYIFSLGYGI